MPPRVYVETTVISYLTARDSRDAIRLAHQAITRRWWADRRPAFDVFVSELVVQEAGAGDAEAARERLAAIREVPVLAVGTDARALAKHLVERRAVPAKAAADAAHIAAPA